MINSIEVVFSLHFCLYRWASSSSPWACTRSSLQAALVSVYSSRNRERFRCQLTSRDPREQAWRDLVTLIKAANIFAMRTLQPHTKHSCTSYCNPSWSCSPGTFSCPGTSFAISLHHCKMRSSQGEKIHFRPTVHNQESRKTKAKLLK